MVNGLENSRRPTIQDVITQEGEVTKFRQANTITRYIISTPSRFVGEIETESFLISSAHENMRIERYTPNPSDPGYRQYFELSIETPEDSGQTVVIPDYSHLAENFCVALSVLFGKRFDSHGLSSQHSRAYMPSNQFKGELYNKALATNSQNLRSDFSVELNLSNFYRISDIVHSYPEEQVKIQSAFLYAGKFYLDAVRVMEDSPEVAFLNLVTACEILASQMNYQQDDLLDDQAKQLLETITKGLPDGVKVARQVKKRMAGISEKFCKFILEHIDESFFSVTESKEPESSLTSDNFRSRLKSAYCIRSTYVHAGQFMENWFSVNYLKQNEEVISGNPVIEDKDMKRHVKKSPTILGMERIVRYVLIQYLIKNKMIEQW